VGGIQANKNEKKSRKAYFKTFLEKNEKRGGVGGSGTQMRKF
jgi:hypothetical protein